MRIKVVVEANDEGGFTVFVPSLPGCVAEGDTPEDALASIRAAIEAHLVPDDDDVLPPAEGATVHEVVL